MCEFVLPGRNNSHEVDSLIGHCSGNLYSNAAKAVDTFLEAGDAVVVCKEDSGIYPRMKIAVQASSTI
jgi:hypothetical protein